MVLIQLASLCVLSAPGPAVEPPEPGKPAPGAHPVINRGSYEPPPLSALLRKQLWDALLNSSPKVRDFVGPQPHNPYLYVPWERKALALLDLREGKKREYQLILGKIAEKRDEAKDRYALFAKTAAKMQRELNRFPVDNPDYTRARQDTIRSCRRSEAVWRVVHDAKVRELALLEKLGRAVIAVREAKRRAAPR